MRRRQRLVAARPAWGRPLPHGAAGRCTPTTAIHSRRASRWGGGNAPAGPRGTAVAHFASPTRFIHQAPHTVWPTGRAHGGVRAQETVGAPRAPAPPTAQRHRPAPSSAPLAACTLHRRKKKKKKNSNHVPTKRGRRRLAALYTVPLPIPAPLPSPSVPLSHRPCALGHQSTNSSAAWLPCVFSSNGSLTVAHHATVRGTVCSPRRGQPKGRRPATPCCSTCCPRPMAGAPLLANATKVVA